MLLPPKSKQIRVLADGDSFYASCEVARRPELYGKIVIVERSDICLAITYPGKELNLGLHTPMREVRRLLKGKEHYIFQADMGYYERVSNNLFELIAQHSNKREQFSVDESFYDWTGLVDDTEEAVTDYAEKLQDYLFKATGIPVSFGFGRTRLIAKMFNKFRKPYGVYGHLEYEFTCNTLRPLKLQAVPFIGKKRASKLHYCDTVGDFMDMKGEKVREILHRDGLKLWLELRGYTALRILRKRGPASIGRARSFHPHFTQCKKTLWKKLMMNFEKAYAQMISENVATRFIGIMFRDKGFNRMSMKKRLQDHTCERHELIQHIKELFQRLYTPGVWYRTTSIYFAELVVVSNRQESLFSVDQDRRQKEQEQKKLQQTVEAINRKLGGMHITTCINSGAIRKIQDNGSKFGKISVI